MHHIAPSTKLPLCPVKRFIVFLLIVFVGNLNVRFTPTTYINLVSSNSRLLFHEKTHLNLERIVEFHFLGGQR